MPEADPCEPSPGSIHDNSSVGTAMWPEPPSDGPSNTSPDPSVQNGKEPGDERSGGVFVAGETDRSAAAPFAFSRYV